MTHTGKRADGSNGRKSAGKDDTPDQKGYKRSGKLETSPSQSVGKDEVASSNLAISSRKHLKSLDFGRFLLQILTIWVVEKYRFEG